MSAGPDALVRRFAATALVPEPDNDLVLRGLLAHGDSDADLSVTWVQLSGHHRRLRTDASTRVYVVVAGVGAIQVGDHPVQDLAPGDTVVIPAGAPYHLDGAMTYLVLNQPGFRDGDDTYLETPGDSVPGSTAPDPRGPTPAGG